MKKIKIGILGAGRGIDIAQNLLLLDNCEVVSLCENNKSRIKYGLDRLGKEIPVYEDFDEFLQSGLDAVVIANFFHEHTPFCIKCFEKNIHVLCECISNSTMAEGVKLIRAYEKSKSIFMLAENYPQMLFNREMKKICDGGTLGKILYAEGEYNHPANPSDISFNKDYIYFVKHWRNFLPRTYYVTHSLAPLMWATGATPKKVTAFAAFMPYDESASARHAGDRAAIITTLNDDGSVFKFTGCGGFGAHSNSYRICGSDGQIENLRGMGEKVMLRYSAWAIPEGREEVNFYEPSWNDDDEEYITQSGHGGGDYIVSRKFVDCIEKGQEPELPYDIYSAINMASVAILGHRSVLNGGMPYDLPDFHNEKTRKTYENDNDSPFYYSDGREPTIPCCSNTEYKPTEEQIRNFEKTLK